MARPDRASNSASHSSLLLVDLIGTSQFFRLLVSMFLFLVRTSDRHIAHGGLVRLRFSTRK